MGNCQAVDAAALVVQHPNGRIERMYWSVTASEVMKTNPGHYVALIIPLSISGDEENNPDDTTGTTTTVRFTRVKLLRPSDTLVLGRAYRLVTSQEVMKVLRAKKNAKTKKNQAETDEKLETDLGKQSSIGESADAGGSKPEKYNQKFKATRQERHRQRTGPVNLSAARSKPWRPSLQSISEASNQ